jgi:hypothetical protein
MKTTARVLTLPAVLALLPLSAAARGKAQWIWDAKVLAEAKLNGVSRGTPVDDVERGGALAVAGRDVFSVKPGEPLQKVASLDDPVTALDYDAERRETWAVLESHHVVRLDEVRFAPGAASKP